MQYLLQPDQNRFSSCKGISDWHWRLMLSLLHLVCHRFFWVNVLTEVGAEAGEMMQGIGIAMKVSLSG